MNGGYQILDLTGTFSFDVDTGSAIRNIPGSYKIASQRNKPVMVTSFEYLDSDNVKLVVHPQYVAFSLLANSSTTFEAEVIISGRALMIYVSDDDNVNIERG